MNLSPITQSFVLHFGEMGSHWGINRTVGQIYALLVVSDQPLNADQIAEKLGISRSNVSMSLKELQSWRLVRLKHLPGDRKDYFSAPDDVWEIARTLFEERRKREIDPTLSVLRTLLMEPAHAEDRYAIMRMREMHDFIELLTQWSAEMQKLSSGTLLALLKLGNGAAKLLELKQKIRPAPDRNSDSGDA